MNHRRNGTADRGATLVEYALIVGVISLLSMSAVTLVGDSTSDSFDNVTAALDDGSTSGVAEPGADTELDADTGPGDDTGVGEETEDTEASEQTEDTEATEIAGPEGSVTTTATSAEITSWKKNRGAWTASVEYSNDWGQDQSLTMEVTAVDDDGNTTTTTIDGFHVPAGGHVTFSHEDNAIKLKKGVLQGVVEVRVKVVSITTTDDNSQRVTYEASDVVSVSVPDTP